MKKFLAYFHNTGCVSAILSKLNCSRLSLYFLYTLLLSAIVCACSNDLDIQQTYSFDFVTMPVQKKIVQNETAEIRCQLVKEGEYKQARFFIRYFQTDGKGELRMDDGTVLLPNDLYPLDRTIFRLYYTSRTTDQQVIDVYIEDNFGQLIKKTFSWQNDNGDIDNFKDEYNEVLEKISYYDFRQFIRVKYPLLATYCSFAE